MKKTIILQSVLCMMCLSVLSYAGFNFGMTGAVKKQVEKLDEKRSNTVLTGYNQFSDSTLIFAPIITDASEAIIITIFLDCEPWNL